MKTKEEDQRFTQEQLFLVQEKLRPDLAIERLKLEIEELKSTLDAIQALIRKVVG